VEGNRVEWTSPAAVGAQFLLLEPTLPIKLADRPVWLVAATLCYSTLQPDVRLTAVFMSHHRGPLSGAASSSLVGAQFEDQTIRDESACRRFELPQPFLLLPGDYVNVRLRFDFDAPDEVHIGASSFELAPA
jgi:hypothetical protein